MKTFFLIAMMLVIQQMAQGVPVAPSRQLPEGVTLRSLYEVANTTANRIIAESVDGYVFLVGVLEKDPIQLPSCFQTRRSSSDLDVNYMEHMKENYQTAAGYHAYYQSVVTFYNSSLRAKPDSLYHRHLYALQATTEELQHSIANMLYAVDSTVILTTPAPPTAPPLEKKGDALANCVDVCLENLTRQTQQLHKFSLERARPDIAGFYRRQQQPEAANP